MLLQILLDRAKQQAGNTGDLETLSADEHRQRCDRALCPAESSDLQVKGRLSAMRDDLALHGTARRTAIALIRRGPTPPPMRSTDRGFPVEALNLHLGPSQGELADHLINAATPLWSQMWADDRSMVMRAG